MPASVVVDAPVHGRKFRYHVIMCADCESCTQVLADDANREIPNRGRKSGCGTAAAGRTADCAVG